MNERPEVKAARDNIRRARRVGAIYTIAILIVGILIGYFAPTWLPTDPRVPTNLVCRFETMQGWFIVDSEELMRDTRMIQVRRGDRILMFERRPAIECTAPAAAQELEEIANE